MALIEMFVTDCCTGQPIIDALFTASPPGGWLPLPGSSPPSNTNPAPQDTLPSGQLGGDYTLNLELNTQVTVTSGNSDGHLYNAKTVTVTVDDFNNAYIDVCLEPNGSITVNVTDAYVGDAFLKPAPTGSHPNTPIAIISDATTTQVPIQSTFVVIVQPGIEYSVEVGSTMVGMNGESPWYETQILPLPPLAPCQQITPLSVKLSPPTPIPPRHHFW